MTFLSDTVIQSPRAFRLAYHDGEQYLTSEYGYLEPDAAETAAPLLNRTRIARGRPPYSHVIVYQGERALDIQPLEAL